MKRILLVHHSHTDIGYTEAQSRIERWHADFIRQALALADRYPGRFRWTCETFWSVERFLERASASEREAFAGAVQRGDLGLSASYLNFNELIDEPTLRAVTRRAVDFGASIDVAVDCAMTADINGHSWGFADVLHDLGVRNLFACVHTHHGRYPLDRTQVPFRWEAPGGGEVLVWSGEHYHFGNELGLVPDAVSSYLTKDECDADMIFHDARGVAEIRIPRYLAGLEEIGYPYDFVPVMASGLRTDNGPPSGAVLEQIDRWNDAHGDVCAIEMATLGDVFAAVRAAEVKIPVHSGDWPDWWSDGVASAPDGTRLHRQAQRDTELARRLGAPPAAIEAVEGRLARYAEHTFSHSESMGRPWHLDVHAIAGRKKADAACALDEVRGLLDDATERLGGGSLEPGRPLAYRVTNPWRRDHAGLARLGVGHEEWHERGLDRGLEVVDAATGEPRRSQAVAAPRGAEVLVPIRLAPGENRDLLIRPTEGPAPDLAPRGESADALATPHVRIGWSGDTGIVRFEDGTGRSLVRDVHRHAPLTPVHELTPARIPAKAGSVRRAMGLNRKGPDVERSAGRLRYGRITARGDAIVRARLRYELTGTTYCSLELTAHVARPRVDVALRIAKDCRWEPENLYLALPFAAGANANHHLFKTGATVRPRIDQIPGTLTDFYAVQEGWASIDDDLGVAIAMLDAPLLQLGSLEPGERLLAGDPRLVDDPALPYAWLLYNGWETNFDASLGGFHEWRFSILWGEDLTDPDRAREAAAAASRDLLVVRRRAER